MGGGGARLEVGEETGASGGEEEDEQASEAGEEGREVRDVLIDLRGRGGSGRPPLDIV